MQNSDPDRKIVALLAKWPEPGHVKTRLGASIGMETAAAVQRALVEQTIALVPPEFELQIWLSPKEQAAAMTEWLQPKHPNLTFHLQPEGDLGVRLSAVFSSNAPQSVAAIGADCPTMTVRELELAFVYLAQNDFVLGPARDGGYYLIAARQPHPALFQNVPWSTNRTRFITYQQARDAGLQWHELAMLDDLDTIEDWQRLPPLLRKNLMRRLGKSPE